MCTTLWSGMGPRPTMTSTCKRNLLNEVAQYKTVCSWSLLLLHNTVGGVLWADEKRTRDALQLSSYTVLSVIYAKYASSCESA